MNELVNRDEMTEDDSIVMKNLNLKLLKDLRDKGLI